MNNNKEYPMYRGLMCYFPKALKAISHLSFIANEQHNPGQPIHWDRSKSTDDLDALLRHLNATTSDVLAKDDDGMLHLEKVAWRACAALEKALEQKEQLGKDNNYKKFIETADQLFIHQDGSTT